MHSLPARPKSRSRPCCFRIQAADFSWLIHLVLQLRHLLRRYSRWPWPAWSQCKLRLLFSIVPLTRNYRSPHPQIQLGGILCFHRITDNRTLWSPLEVYRTLSRSYTEVSLTTIMIVTSIWDGVELELGSQQEPRLFSRLTESNWKYARYNRTQNSAWDIICRCLLASYVAKSKVGEKYTSRKREGAEITRWELPKVPRLTDVNNWLLADVATCHMVPGPANTAIDLFMPGGLIKLWTETQNTWENEKPLIFEVILLITCNTVSGPVNSVIDCIWKLSLPG